MLKSYNVVIFLLLATWLYALCVTAAIYDGSSSIDNPYTDPPFLWNSTDPWPLAPRPYNRTGLKWTQLYNCTGPLGDNSFILTSPPKCGTPDGLDYYGSGVRLGFYFAWFGSFAANNFVPDEIAGATDANAIFLFALGISIWNGTVGHKFYKVDALIMNLIAIGTTVGTMSIWGYRSCRFRRDGRTALKYYGGSGTYIRLLLCILANAYWCWFWYGPFKRQLGVPTCDPRCDTAWIFGHPISSGIRWLFFAVGILLMIIWIPMALGAFVTLYARLGNMWKFLKQVQKDKNRGKAEDVYRQSTKIQLKTGLSNKQLARVSYVWMVLNALWFAFIIALTEKTLHENSVPASWTTSKSVSSPSQLIPLLIGVCTFGRMLYIAHETRRYPKVKPSCSEHKNCASGSEGIEPTLPEDVTVAGNEEVETDDDDDNEEAKSTNKFLRIGERILKFLKPLKTWVDKKLLVFSPGYQKYLSYDDSRRRKGPPRDHEKPFRGLGIVSGLLHTWLPWLKMDVDSIHAARDDAEGKTAISLKSKVSR